MRASRASTHSLPACFCATRSSSVYLSVDLSRVPDTNVRNMSGEESRSIATISSWLLEEEGRDAKQARDGVGVDAPDRRNVIVECAAERRTHDDQGRSGGSVVLPGGRRSRS